MSRYVDLDDAMSLGAMPKRYMRYQTSNLDDAYEQGWEDALTCLGEEPAADVELVVHGKWEWDTGDIYQCSVCGRKVHIKEVMFKPAYNYCPYCGALMREGCEI